MKDRTVSLRRLLTAFAMLAACFAAFCLFLPRVARAETLNGLVGDENTLLPEKITFGVTADLEMPKPRHGETIIFTVGKAGGDGVSFGASLANGTRFYETKTTDGNLALDTAKPIANAGASYFSDYINGLSAGVYTVTAYVPASDEYSAYTHDFVIEVASYNIETDTEELFSWNFTGEAEVVYNGEENNIPAVEVYFDGELLTRGVDYTLAGTTANVGESDLIIIGNGNFGGMVTETAAFRIVTAKNDWVLAPSVNVWNYGAFDISRHGFTAQPRYLEEGQSVIYTVSRESAPDGIETAPDEPVYVPIDGLKDITDLEMMGDDDKAATIAVLNSLPAGIYYLTSHVNSTNNYTAIDPIVSQFSIGVAENVWRVTPYIMQWRYGSYDKDYNIIEAEASYVDDEHPVLYTVSTDREGNSVVSGLKEFAAPDGVVAEHIAELLGGLDVGTYYLTATVKRSSNFNAAAPAVMKFDISKANNYWDVAPALENWVVGEFDPDVNKVEATSRFGTASVVITDTTEHRNVVYDRLNNINELKSVGAGTYILTAVVEEDDNYTGLSTSFVFRVGVPATKLVKRGLPWWGTVMIVVAALGIVALVFFILHKRGVFKMMSGKVLDMYMERQTQKVIAATLYAKKRDEARKAAAEAEAQNAAATTVEAEEVNENELPAAEHAEEIAEPEKAEATESAPEQSEAEAENAEEVKEEEQVTEDEANETEAPATEETAEADEPEEKAEENAETEPKTEEAEQATEEAVEPEEEAAATEEPKPKRTKKEAEVKIVKNTRKSPAKGTKSGTAKSTSGAKKSTTAKKTTASGTSSKPRGKKPSAKNM